MCSCTSCTCYVVDIRRTVRCSRYCVSARSYLVDENSGCVQVRDERGHVSIHETMHDCAAAAGYPVENIRRRKTGKRTPAGRAGKVCKVSDALRKLAEAAAGEELLGPRRSLPSARNDRPHAFLFQVYFCPTRVASAPTSVAAASVAIAAAAAAYDGRLSPSTRPPVPPRCRLDVVNIQRSASVTSYRKQREAKLSNPTTDRDRIVTFGR